MARLALKDVTFSDGTFIPKGTLVSAPTWALHRDETLYPDPHVFDPFRFARLSEAAPGECTKYQFVQISTDFIAFGHGRHAWSAPFVVSCVARLLTAGILDSPGRLVASLELKAIVAHLIMNYDMKIAGDGARPNDVFFGSNVLPHPSAKIMLRQRQPA